MKQLLISFAMPALLATPAWAGLTLDELANQGPVNARRVIGFDTTGGQVFYRPDSKKGKPSQRPVGDVMPFNFSFMVPEGVSFQNVIETVVRQYMTTQGVDGAAIDAYMQGTDPTASVDLVGHLPEVDRFTPQQSPFQAHPTHFTFEGFLKDHGGGLCQNVRSDFEQCYTLPGTDVVMRVRGNIGYCSDFLRDYHGITQTPKGADGFKALTATLAADFERDIEALGVMGAYPLLMYHHLSHYDKDGSMAKRLKVPAEQKKKKKKKKHIKSDQETPVGQPLINGIRQDVYSSTAFPDDYHYVRLLSAFGDEITGFEEQYGPRAEAADVAVYDMLLQNRLEVAYVAQLAPVKKKKQKVEVVAETHWHTGLSVKAIEAILNRYKHRQLRLTREGHKDGYLEESDLYGNIPRDPAAIEKFEKWASRVKAEYKDI